LLDSLLQEIEEAAWGKCLKEVGKVGEVGVAMLSSKAVMNFMTQLALVVLQK